MASSSRNIVLKGVEYAYLYTLHRDVLW